MKPYCNIFGFRGKANMTFSDKESLWCKWVHSTFLKTKNFWVVKQPFCCSWAWTKLLQLGIECRLHFHWRIGDGLTTSLSFDNWHPRVRWIYSIRIPSSIARASLDKLWLLTSSLRMDELSNQRFTSSHLDWNAGSVLLEGGVVGHVFSGFSLGDHKAEEGESHLASTHLE